MARRADAQGTDEMMGVGDNVIRAAWPGWLVWAALILLVGCGSPPMRTLAGARAYTAGTEALERGESDLAIAHLERAAELVPHASEVRNHLGLAYWSAGRGAPARAAFERAIELDCENAAARSNLARLDSLERAGEPVAASALGSPGPVPPGSDRRGGLASSPGEGDSDGR